MPRGRRTYKLSAESLVNLVLQASDTQAFLNQRDELANVLNGAGLSISAHVHKANLGVRLHNTGGSRDGRGGNKRESSNGEKLHVGVWRNERRGEAESRAVGGGRCALASKAETFYTSPHFTARPTDNAVSIDRESSMRPKMPR